MITNSRCRLLLDVAVCVMLAGTIGCGSSPPEPGRMPTYPVTGEVIVDGQPADELEVTCHEVKSMGSEAPLKLTANTDHLGKFNVSTYSPGDGVPEGEFAVTFLWGKLNVISTRYEGPDRLNDRYSSPTESKVKFTSSKGKQVNLGKIELTTK